MPFLLPNQQHQSTEGIVCGQYAQLYLVGGSNDAAFRCLFYSIVLFVTYLLIGW